MLLPLQGVVWFCNFTQGDALGYVPIGLTARLIGNFSVLRVLFNMPLSLQLVRFLFTTHKQDVIQSSNIDKYLSLSMMPLQGIIVIILFTTPISGRTKWITKKP